MKKLFLLLITLTLICCKSQENLNVKKDSLKESLNKYVSAFNSQEYESVVDMMPDEIFTNYSKESVVKQLQSTLKTLEFIHIDSVDYKTIYAPLKFKDVLYSRIDYSSLLRMRLKNSNSKSIDRFKSAMNKMYTADLISLNDSTNVFSIQQTSTMYTFSHDNGNSWKLIESKQNGRYKNLIPEELHKKLDVK